MANTVVRLFRKLNFYTIKKGIRYLRHFGVKEFLIRLRDRIEPEEVPYEPWYEQHRASEQTLERQWEHKWKNPVLISIAVPLYRTPLPYLEQMVESVKAQSYPYWELCLVNGSPEDEELAAALAVLSGDEGTAGMNTLRPGAKEPQSAVKESRPGARELSSEAKGIRSAAKKSKSAKYGPLARLSGEK
ncbi:MAG: hypothetical protein LUF30_13275 [Lachnospiraceae bacterium]|nr:hypothetical protein [Lachnospiraceae bacterium]